MIKPPDLRERLAALLKLGTTRYSHGPQDQDGSADSFPFEVAFTIPQWEQFYKGITALITEASEHVTAAYEDAAQAIRRWADGWRQRIDEGRYQGETLRYADVRRDEGIDIAKHIEGIAPAHARKALAERDARVRAEAPRLTGEKLKEIALRHIWNSEGWSTVNLRPQLWDAIVAELNLPAPDETAVLRARLEEAKWWIDTARDIVMSEVGVVPQSCYKRVTNLERQLTASQGAAKAQGGERQ